ncbi:MAG: leucyl aminopeptidase [Isosphaeraceae bacterium]
MMQVATLSLPIVSVEAERLCVGIFEGQTEMPAALMGTPVADLITSLLASGELSGKLGETTPILGASGLSAGTLIVFGLGGRDEIGPGKSFAAGVALTKSVCDRPRATLAVALPDWGDDRALTSAFVEGLVVGTRGPGLRKSEASRHAIASLSIVVPPRESETAALDAAIRRGVVVGESVNLARDLVNTPPAEKTPTRLAQRAREVAEAAGLEVEVWDEDRIRAERFGGLLGVAAGSEEPPAFVVLERRAGGDAPATALVGKGITFDSGGLSLKPSASMEDMKSDMTGAAVVLAAMSAIARLNLPVNVRGYLAISENMTGGRAMKLGDVLTMRNGKTVEVLNTDAEGRLVLADTLSFAVESRPARVLDLATLTGACMVALGTKIAGLFSNDHGFAGEVLSACRGTGERAWRLPLDSDFKDLLKSHVADLKNVGGKWGGAVTAAKFLEQFVGDVPWVHLDVAGPSWAESDSATRDPGGTGCFVRTLVALLEGEGAAASP